MNIEQSVTQLHEACITWARLHGNSMPAQPDTFMVIARNYWKTPRPHSAAYLCDRCAADPDTQDNWSKWSDISNENVRGNWRFAFRILTSQDDATHTDYFAQPLT